MADADVDVALDEAAITQQYLAQDASLSAQEPETFSKEVGIVSENSGKNVNIKDLKRSEYWFYPALVVISPIPLRKLLVR